MGAQLSKGGAAEAESAAAKTNGQVKDASVAMGATFHPIPSLTFTTDFSSSVSDLRVLSSISVVCVRARVLADFW